MSFLSKQKAMLGQDPVKGAESMMERVEAMIVDCLDVIDNR